MQIDRQLSAATAFEKSYNEIRRKEQRILDIERIKKLPETDPGYVHHHEWNRRVRSTSRFLAYLANKPNAHILDIGCGNGWLIHKIAPLAKTVTGLDINELELEQAAIVLGEFDNVSLKYADIFKLPVQEKFDIILLNASIQYFENTGRLFETLVNHLGDSGEIHIIDSPFYSNKGAASAAKARTLAYYTQNGIPEMANYYNHHTFDDLKPYPFQIMHDPNHWSQKMKRRFVKDSSFFWIKVSPA